jgi:hypothetical protein
MNSLSEFKALLEAHGIVVKESVGYQFNVRRDIWTMLDGNYYCNNVIAKPKEKLQEYLTAPKEKKNGRAKSIQAGKR